MSEFDYTLAERTDRDIVSKLYSSFFAVEDVTFVIPAEDTNVVAAELQLVDLAGQPVLKSMILEIYLSSTADVVTVGAADTAMAITTSGAGTLVLETLAGGIYTFQTDENGKLDIDVTDEGDLLRYLVAKMPNGEIAVSSLLTFEV